MLFFLSCFLYGLRNKPKRKIVSNTLLKYESLRKLLASRCAMNICVVDSWRGICSLNGLSNQLQPLVICMLPFNSDRKPLAIVTVFNSHLHSHSSWPPGFVKEKDNPTLTVTPPYNHHLNSSQSERMTPPPFIITLPLQTASQSILLGYGHLGMNCTPSSVEGKSSSE